MLAVTYSGAILGVEAFPVTVEANSGEKGEPRCVLVGLPDTAVKESMDRVFSSLSNTGYSKPRTHVTINLAPGDLKKEGASFDLPIALSLLSSMGNFPSDELSEYLVAGELGLSGEIRDIRGGLTLAMLASKMGKKGVLLPEKAADEACLVEEVNVYPVKSLAEAVAFFESSEKPSPLMSKESSFARAELPLGMPDFQDVKGQLNLRRAVEVAVAGSHNMLLIGPPGSGKSMISKRIPTILPVPSTSEYLEMLNVYSVGGQSQRSKPNGWVRPFRSPHHTISDVGLIGGGTLPGPGEISLAHNGVLFLDELPEFKRSALEVLRQPLEDGEVTISRSAGKVTLPSRFMLVAAMNPCPCGYLGGIEGRCRCSIPQIERYRSKISGPLLDRIDIHVEAPAVRIEELQEFEKGESSVAMRKRIEDCRRIQSERFEKFPIQANANMPEALIEETCRLEKGEMDLLRTAMKKLCLSARAYGRILKVARTIADLSFSSQIKKDHLLEAIQYRSLDRTHTN
jgi:magnesium chelatase family protein